VVEEAASVSIRGVPPAPGTASRLLPAIFWLALLAAGAGYGLGRHPLIDPDEGRNAEVGREMAATNDYVVPRLDGLPYLDKPVLFFALEAAVMEVLGPTELAARLPSLAFAVLTALLAGWFGRELWGGSAGTTAATAALAAPLTIAFARTVIFDSLLAFFVSLACVAFYMAIEKRRTLAGRASAWGCLAWGAIAFGVLAKGPVAVALPFMVALPFAVWRRQTRAVFPLAGIAICAALVAPWVAAMSRAIPEFLHYALVTETWGRLTSGTLRRTGPPWYFVPYVLGGMFPWSIVALAGWWNGRRLRRPDGALDPRTVFLLLWIAVPFLFFSLSQSKRPGYVLPLVPAVALLVAGLWSDDEGAIPGVRGGAAALAAAGLVFGVVAVAIRPPDSASPEIARLIPGTAGAVAAVLLAAAALAGFGARRRRVALVGLAIPSLCLPLLGAPIMAQAAAERSTRALARRIASSFPAGIDVVTVSTFPPSLPFYLGRRVLVASDNPQELTSNYVASAFPRWLAEERSPLRRRAWLGEAARRCPSPMLFLVRSVDASAKAALAIVPLPLVAEDQDYLLYGPCVPAGAR
jgi:4-amino-4-deoxy-L-arabinose transferase-like glycosyltransferase